MSYHPALMLLLLMLPPPAVTYRGTVQAIQAHPAAIDLVTGVGFALRMVHVRTGPATTVDSAGTTIPLAHVRLGDVISIECSATPAGLLADHIEKVMPQQPAGTP